MSILVTGHKGFIGSNFVNYVRKNTDWAISGWEIDPNNPKDKPENIHKYAWVIHLGGISSTTETDVDKLMDWNFDFSKWLYRQCRDNGVNLQYSSSASVYGLGHNGFKEDVKKDPQCPYAWSKYLFDRWVEKKIQQDKMIVQGFRYFNIYGHGEMHKGNMASPVTKFTQAALENKPIEIFENSQIYKRDFVWVGDCIRAQIQFIKHVRESGIWNIGTGQPVSFHDIATAIMRKYKVPVHEIPMPAQLKDQYQDFTSADLTKFNQTLPDFEWTNVIDWIADNNPCTILQS